MRLKVIHTPTSDWLVFADASTTSDLYIASHDGKATYNLTRTPALHESILAVNQAGTEILVLENNPMRIQTNTVYRQDIFTGKKVFLFEKRKLHVAEASWSPDGKYLVYSMSRNRKQPALYIHPNGASASQILAERAPCLRGRDKRRDITQLQWSPDSEWIYFTATLCGGGIGLYRIHPDGTEESVIASPMMSHRDYYWSEDGQWLFWMGEPTQTHVPISRSSSDGSHAEEIMIGEFPLDLFAVTPANWVYILAHTHLSRMRPDGTARITVVDALIPESRMPMTSDWLYFRQWTAGGYQIYRVNLASLESHPLTRTGDNDILTLSPDGEWLYFNKRDPIGSLPISYRMRVDGSDIQMLQQRYSENLEWVVYPNSTWHFPIFLLSAFGIGLLGLLGLVRKSRLKSS